MNIFNIFKKKKKESNITQLVKDIIKVIEDDEKLTGKTKFIRGEFAMYDIPWDVPKSNTNIMHNYIRIYVPFGENSIHWMINIHKESYHLNDDEVKLFDRMVEHRKELERLREENIKIEKENMKNRSLKSLLGVNDVKNERKNKLKNIINK